jgi:hypothetical protein
MDYDGGWELRICRWVSWLALAGVGFEGSGGSDDMAYARLAHRAWKGFHDAGVSYNSVGCLKIPFSFARQLQS